MPAVWKARLASRIVVDTIMDITKFLTSAPANSAARAATDGEGLPKPAEHDKRFDQASFGTRIRQVRKDKGWTLKELSERSGISQSTLSRVETGQVTLSFERTHALTAALGIGLTRLLMDAVDAPRTGAVGWKSLTRRGEGNIVEQANAKFEYVCSDVLHKTLVAGVVTVKAHTLEEHGPLVQHPGEEFLHVLSGGIVLVTEHYRPVVLETGDSIQFDSTMRHAVISAGEEEARVLYCGLDPRHR